MKNSKSNLFGNLQVIGFKHKRKFVILTDFHMRLACKISLEQILQRHSHDPCKHLHLRYFR